MKTEPYSHIIGRTIKEVIISVPDRPVSMSDQSESVGYIRLDNGACITIDYADFAAVLDLPIAEKERDRKIESEFSKALGSEIIAVKDHEIFITGDMKISVVLGQFWIRPTLEDTK